MGTIPSGPPPASVELVAVDVELARSLVAGEATRYALGEGWPHADTSGPLGLVASGHRTLLWLVLADGLVVGDAGTHGLPDERGTIEIGYGLAAPSRGRGLGRALVAAVLTELARRGDVRLVFARTRPDNLASQRVLERNGFVYVGEDGPYLRYERPIG